MRCVSRRGTKALILQPAQGARELRVQARRACLSKGLGRHPQTPLNTGHACLPCCPAAQAQKGAVLALAILLLTGAAPVMMRRSAARSHSSTSPRRPPLASVLLPAEAASPVT